MARWFVQRPNGVFGPLEVSDLVALAKKEGLGPQDFIRGEESGELVRAITLPELEDVFGSPQDRAAWPMSEGAIIAINLCAPLAGAMMYYAWRNKHLEAARFANRMSFIAIAIYLCGFCCLAFGMAQRF